MGRIRKKLFDLTKKGIKTRLNSSKRQKTHSFTTENYRQSFQVYSFNQIDSDSEQIKESEFVERTTDEEESIQSYVCETADKEKSVQSNVDETTDNEQSIQSHLEEPRTFGDKFNDIKDVIKVNDDPRVNCYVSKVLQKAAVEYNFPRIGISQVLKKLNPFFPLIPNDYRTLLGTPRKTELRVVDPGRYLHLGIAESICTTLKDSLLSLEHLKDTLTLDFFVDGVAIFQVSTEKSFWVILSRLVQLDKIFPVGIYNGKTQPASFNDLLSEFVEEVKAIKLNGINLNGRYFQIQIRNFCLDSPAKASVCCIVHPTGYKSCLYCKVNGRYFNNRVVFTDTNQARRTDNDFKIRTDPQHHKGDPILEKELDLKMVSQFPPDYLHVVLLGATKKILKKWFQPVKPLLARHSRKQVSSHLMMCNDFVPSEIHRKCRPIEEILTYHGNELRVFLLKVGHVVLKNNIPPELYDNFLLLHCAITILCDPELCVNKNQTAASLLNAFIEDCANIYGEEFVVSVIHACEHLPEAVMRQKAPLDKFSTFAFESFMTPIKKYLHTTRAPLAQIHRRVVEMMKASNIASLKTETTIKSFVEFIGQNEEVNSYKSVCVNGVKISSIGSRDRFMLTHRNEIVVCLKIQRVANELVITARELFQIGDFYKNPISSTKLNIYWCMTTYCAAIKTLSIKEISRKMFAIPFDESSMVFSPLQKL